MDTKVRVIADEYDREVINTQHKQLLDLITALSAASVHAEKAVEVAQRVSELVTTDDYYLVKLLDELLLHTRNTNNTIAEGLLEKEDAPEGE